SASTIGRDEGMVTCRPTAHKRAKKRNRAIHCSGRLPVDRPLLPGGQGGFPEIGLRRGIRRSLPSLPLIRQRKPDGSSGLKERIQEFCGMHCFAAGEMLNLHAAREAWSDDDRVGARLANGRKQSLLTHETGDLIMLLLVAERPGHAAATGVQI